jgi:hypothetical protein
MTDTNGFLGRPLVDIRHERIGRITEVLSHEQGDWAVVRVGLLRLHKACVPLCDAREEDGDVWVVYERDHVMDVPGIQPDGDAISDEDADRLHRYYGLEPVIVPEPPDDEEVDLSRETRDAKPPQMQEGPDSPLAKRRRERAEELGVPQDDEPVVR